jgi:hypothetical protein
MDHFPDVQSCRLGCPSRWRASSFE